MADLTSPHVRLAALGLASAAVVLLLAAVPWRIGEGAVRAEAERRIRMALDAPDASIGPMSLTLLPSPKLSIDRIRFTRADGVVSGEARSAIVNVRIDGLIRGIAKPVGLTLVQPDLTVRMAEGPAGVFDGVETVRAAVTGMLSARGSINGLNEIAIENGRLEVSRSSGTTRFERVNLNAEIGSPARPLKLSANARTQGQDVRLAFAGASPEALRKGTEEPVSFNITMPALTAEFRGTGNLSRELATRGLLSVEVAADGAPNLKAALANLGLPAPQGIRMRAGLTTAQRAATVSEMTILTGQHRIEGVGAVRHDGQRWQVAATLATPMVDLTPLAQLAARTRSADGGWSDRRIDLAPLFGANIDLRISADQAVMGQQKFTRAGIAVITRASRIEASLNDSVFHNGRARARLIATRVSDDVEYKLTAGLEAVDFGAAMLLAKLPQRVIGTGNAEVALDSSGQSAAEIAANLEGRMSFAMRAGELVGIDLNRLANRRPVRPDILLAEALAGRTAFESASLSMRIDQGQARPVEGALQANRLVGMLTGEIDLSGDEIRLNGNVVQLRVEPGLVEPLPVIEFSVSGPLSEPRVTPNIASLLRRS